MAVSYVPPMMTAMLKHEEPVKNTTLREECIDLLKTYRPNSAPNALKISTPMQSPLDTHEDFCQARDAFRVQNDQHVQELKRASQQDRELARQKNMAAFEAMCAQWKTGVLYAQTEIAETPPKKRVVRRKRKAAEMKTESPSSPAPYFPTSVVSSLPNSPHSPMFPIAYHYPSTPPAAYQFSTEYPPQTIVYYQTFHNPAEGVPAQPKKPMMDGEFAQNYTPALPNNYFVPQFAPQFAQNMQMMAPQQYHNQTLPANYYPQQQQIAPAHYQADNSATFDAYSVEAPVDYTDDFFSLI